MMNAVLTTMPAAMSQPALSTRMQLATPRATGTGPGSSRARQDMETANSLTPVLGVYMHVFAAIERR